jgi:hypothetical protein
MCFNARSTFYVGSPESEATSSRSSGTPTAPGADLAAGGSNIPITHKQRSIEVLDMIAVQKAGKESCGESTGI